MCFEEIEELEEKMFSLAAEFSVAYGVCQDLESQIESVYEEIESLISEHDLDYDLPSLTHVKESSF